MKKWIAWMLALICIGMLPACRGSEPTSDTPADTWGVTMELKSVTPGGADLVIRHSGDAPEGMLQTGSPYWVERRQDGEWVSLDDGEERAWTMEAWLIPMNGSREDEVNWVNLYGQLPVGQYRLGKEIMLLRGPGDYDERPCYAEFVIE